MRIGIFGGDTTNRTIDEVVGAARAAKEQGFASYWLPQIFGLDAMTVLAIVGREVPGIELGTGVVPTYPRHPVVMAQQALTVQAASGNRFVLGIGLSHQMVIEGMFGYSFDKPVRHMREYLSALLPLLRGEHAQVAGETLSTNATITSTGTEPCAVMIAALGTQMLELAGTYTDGTITWMTGPATLGTHTVPTINAAARRAGRPTPRIGASLPLCITEDVVAARERAAVDFQVYGFLPSYRAMLDREGAAGPADVAIVGDAATCGAAIDALEAAGVTDFVASEFGSRAEQERTREFLRTRL